MSERELGGAPVATADALREEGPVDRGPWRAVPWLGLLVVAQLASLLLIDAGWHLHFQHLAIATAWPSPIQWVCLGLLGGEAALVVWRVRRHARRLRAAWARTPGGRRRLKLMGVAAFLFATAAFPSRDPVGAAVEFTVSFGLRLLHLAFIGIAAIEVLDRVGSRRPERLLRWVRGESGRGGDRRLVAACAVWTLLAASLLGWFSYQWHPHVTDEVGYLLHARYLAEGRLSIPAPRVEEAFEIYLVACRDGRCWVPTPPGWPALLAVGVALGIPWLVNPILAALCVPMVFFLATFFYDRATARASVLLLAASPWFLFVSMSLMTHAFSLFCALLGAVGVVKMLRSGRLAWGVPAGVALGTMSLIRPLEALGAALVLGAGALAGRGSAPRRILRLAVVGAFGVGVAVLNPLYNRAMTGDPRAVPLMEYADEVLGPGTMTLGFGPEKGVWWNGIDPFPGHGLRDVIVNAQLNATSMDIELFGWLTGSLFLLVVLLLWGGVRRRDAWVLLGAATLPLLHSFFWYSGGPDFGARYWYLSLAPVAVLSARARLFGEWLARGTPAEGAVVVGAALLSLSALATFVPWRAADKYHRFRGMRPDVRELLAREDLRGSVILVRGPDYPDVGSAFPYNGLDPESPDPLFLWGRDADLERRIRAAYPDRPIGVLEGPTLTGDGYRWLARPGEPDPGGAAAPEADPPH